jgi:hypothetical protein
LYSYIVCVWLSSRRGSMLWLLLLLLFMDCSILGVAYLLMQLPTSDLDECDRQSLWCFSVCPPTITVLQVSINKECFLCVRIKNLYWRGICSSCIPLPTPKVLHMHSMVGKNINTLFLYFVLYCVGVQPFYGSGPITVGCT